MILDDDNLSAFLTKSVSFPSTYDGSQSHLWRIWPKEFHKSLLVQVGKSIIVDIFFEECDSTEWKWKDKEMVQQYLKGFTIFADN